MEPVGQMGEMRIDDKIETSSPVSNDASLSTRNLKLSNYFSTCSGVPAAGAPEQEHDLLGLLGNFSAEAPEHVEGDQTRMMLKVEDLLTPVAFRLLITSLLTLGFVASQAESARATLVVERRETREKT